MSVRKVAIFYGHVASNLGDLAINLGEAALLRRAFPGAKLHFVLLDAEKSAYLPLAHDSLAGHDVSFFRANHWKALEYLSRPAALLEDCGVGDADLVALAASEHLFHYAEGRNQKSLFWRSLPALAAKAAGKRCVVLPSTFGPFESEGSKALAAALLAAVDGAAVREAHSASLLAGSLGIGAPRALLDPAFFLDPLRRGAAACGQPVLGLAMRAEDRGMRLSSSGNAPGGDIAATHAFEFSLALCRAHRGAGGRMRLFVQTSADEALAGSIREALSSDGHGDAVELCRPASVHAYLEAIGEVDAMVAARFHAVVLAMVAGVPACGAYYDAHGHKMPGLFASLGMADQCVALTATPPEEAAEAVTRSLAALRSASDVLQGQIEPLRRETVSWLRETENAELDSKHFLRLLDPLGELAGVLIQKGQEAEARRRGRPHPSGETEELIANMRVLAEARVSRAERRTVELEHRLGATERRLAEARQRLGTLEREATFAKRQLERINASAAYRAGREVVEAVKRPQAIPLLPFRLCSIYRERKGTRSLVAQMSRMGDAPAHACAHATPDEEALLAQAPETLVEQVLKSRAPAKDKAWRLARLSKLFSDSGRLEEGCHLARTACDVMPSESTYRALFWALQKAGRVEEMAEAVEAIEGLLGPRATAKQKQMLQNLKSQSLGQLQLGDLVVEKGERRNRPIENRLCYVLHNSAPYSSGGYATRAHGVAAGLQSHGYEVIAITRPGFPVDIKTELDPGTVPSSDSVDGVRYERLLKPTRRQYPLNAFMPLAADVLEARFRELRPEAVVAASNYICALPALIAARRLGIDFIYEVRGFWEITRLSREPGYAQHASFKIQEMMEAFVCREADRVLTLTRAMKAELVRRGVQAQKIDLAPNACEPDLFTPRPRDRALAVRLGLPADVPVIGYVGTFVDYEGLDDLAQACGLVARKGIDFRLLLVGNENVSGSGHGPIAEEILKTAAAGGFADRLVMPGRVPHREVASYYSLIDIAPFPRKPWPVCEMVSPMKPLEALAMEKTVVVSSVGALAEMIEDKRHGLVFEKGDVAALAEALEAAIASADLRRKLGRQGRRHVVEHRTWKRTARVFDGALQALRREKPDLAMDGPEPLRHASPHSSC